MTNDIEQQQNPRNGKAAAGIVLLVVGMVLLVHQFNFFFFPHWLFDWPIWLVLWGLFLGVRSNFQKPASYILMGLGVILLITRENEDVVWPLLIIAFGLWMILRRHNPYSKDKEYWNAKHGHKWDWRNQAGPTPNNPPMSDATYSDATYTEVPPRDSSSSFRPTGDDYIDAVSVFGGIKKVVLSKDFKGGDIVNIFGGAELDFMQADINGRVFIDITQIFGGVKIIVPSNWQVVSDIAAVFASVDDKRIKTAAGLSSDKILVLKGVSMFAGIDIRSY